MRGMSRDRNRNRVRAILFGISRYTHSFTLIPLKNFSRHRFSVCSKKCREKSHINHEINLIIEYEQQNHIKSEIRIKSFHKSRINNAKTAPVKSVGGGNNWQHAIQSNSFQAFAYQRNQVTCSGLQLHCTD